MSATRQAVTSLIVGEKYVSDWTHRILPTWAFYCERHQIDLVVFLAPLDGSDWAKKRKLNWQKCLVLSQAELQSYEQVVWLDADVVINARHAPSVFDECPPEKIGGVGFDALPTQPHITTSSAQLTIGELERSFDEVSIRELIVTYEGRHLSIEDASESIKKLYLEKLVPFQVDQSINTGTMVLSPHYHRELFERIYRTYEDIYQPISDQFAIPAEAYHAGIVHNLDSRFNVQVNGEIASKYPFLIFTGKEMIELQFLCLQASFVSAYFLHFAAAQQRMEFFRPLIFDWKDFARLGPNLFPAIALKKATFDPTAVTGSYVGCVAELMEANPITPRVAARVFSRSFTSPTIIYDRSVIDVASLVGFYESEAIASIGKTYRWLDGRSAQISVLTASVLSESRFLKFEVRIHYFYDRRTISMDRMLAVSILVNGYAHIGRDITGDDVENEHAFVISYSGFCWTNAGDFKIRVVAPNWTTYSMGLGDDPRPLSVAVFSINLRLINFDKLY